MRTAMRRFKHFSLYDSQLTPRVAEIFCVSARNARSSCGPPPAQLTTPCSRGRGWVLSRRAWGCASTACDEFHAGTLQQFRHSKDRPDPHFVGITTGDLKATEN